MTTIMSSATPPNSPIVLKAFPNARKLFQIGSLPIGMMCWGTGNIGARTIENLALEFGLTCTANTVQGAAIAFANFILPIYTAEYGSLAQAQQPAMGFFFGGYSQGQPLGDEYEFLLPAKTIPTPIRSTNDCGASWRGIDGPLNRLFFGFDGRIPDELTNAGVAPAIVSANFNFTKWVFPMVIESMPLQDGINFAEFLLRTTTGMCEIITGSAACGGPLQVAVIMPTFEFQWIARPQLHLRGGDLI